MDDIIHQMFFFSINKQERNKIKVIGRHTLKILCFSESWRPGADHLWSKLSQSFNQVNIF